MKKQDRRRRFQQAMPSRRGGRSKCGSLFNRVRMETGMMRFEGDRDATEEDRRPTEQGGINEEPLNE